MTEPYTGAFVIQGESETVTEVWLDSPLMDRDDQPYMLDHQPLPGIVRALRFYVMFLFLWQSMFRVSDSAMNVLFTFFAMFLTLVLAAVPSNEIHNFVNSLPRTTAAA